MIHSVNKSEQFTLIKLRGTLEIGKQAKLKEDLLKQIYPGSSKVILDFKAVEFIDSACLGILISLTRKLREQGGDMCLANLQEDVHSIFQITRLDKIFKIYENTEDAFK